MKNFELKSFASDAELARAAAQDWLNVLQQSKGPHLAALSGGRIAKTFCIAVAERAKVSGVSLSDVDFFWADERCVPPSDAESNFRLAKENLFDPLAVAPAKIHRLKGELPPAEAVAEANATLLRLAPKNEAGVPVLDLIFLGLGEDGHTASLMPNAPEQVLRATAPFVHVANSPKPPPNRISMTYPVLAAAKSVWMLATGAGKAEAFSQSLRSDSTTPFGRVLQSRAQTIIYSDLRE